MPKPLAIPSNGTSFWNPLKISMYAAMCASTCTTGVPAGEDRNFMIGSSACAAMPRDCASAGPISDASLPSIWRIELNAGMYGISPLASPVSPCAIPASASASPVTAPCLLPRMPICCRNWANAGKTI